MIDFTLLMCLKKLYVYDVVVNVPLNEIIRSNFVNFTTNKDNKVKYDKYLFISKV